MQPIKQVESYSRYNISILTWSNMNSYVYNNKKVYYLVNTRHTC